MPKKFVFIGFLILTSLALAIIFSHGQLIGFSRNDWTKLTCKGTNKKLHTSGWGPVTCLTTYPDAGKSCKSSSECLSGHCVVSTTQSNPYCREEKTTPLCLSCEAQVETYITGQILCCLE